MAFATIALTTEDASEIVREIERALGLLWHCYRAAMKRYIQ